MQTTNTLFKFLDEILIEKMFKFGESIFVNIDNLFSVTIFFLEKWLHILDTYYTTCLPNKV